MATLVHVFFGDQQVDVVSCQHQPSSFHKKRISKHLKWVALELQRPIKNSRIIYRKCLNPSSHVLTVLDKSCLVKRPFKVVDRNKNASSTAKNQLTNALKYN
jgi:hypothetical protein